MEALKQVKKLLTNVNQIKDLFQRKIPMWHADKKTYDKTRFGFVEGGSDGWYKDCEINIHFAAWCGTCGSSDTYKQIELDGDVFKKHLMLYLNKNKETIMMSIAESIENEAKDLKSKAEKELNDELSKLKELDNCVVS